MSERWAEHEQVRRIPPGARCFRAASFIDLYPASPSCFFLRSLMNAGGSSMIAGNVSVHSLRYFFTSSQINSHADGSKPLRTMFSLARSSARLEESTLVTALAPPAIA